MIQTILQSWQKDRLHTAMVWCWYATVITSFWGSTVISLTVPAVGELFPFRIFLPITALLYLIWMVRTREFVWGELSFVEKVTYLLAVIMVLYGAASLPRAIELSHTFTKLFNLCLDMAFFLLFLRLCRYADIRKTTLRICVVMLAIMLMLGTWEVLFGGIWNPYYDDWKRFTFFNDIYQFPVVFSSNTNDYAATIGFLFATLLLWKLNPSHKWDGKDIWGIILAGVFSYFVMMAANGRLVLAGFYCTLLGAFFCLWIGRKKGRILITALLLVGLLGIEFANRYEYLIPQIQAYVEAVFQEPSSQPNQEPVTPPSIDLSRPGSESLSDQFFAVDDETGETAIRADDSAGVRLRLLLHAVQCFKESYGLGVGLGNTEMLARDRVVTGTEKFTWSIHCFLARILGDYGIFVLIPLLLIGLSLLRSVLRIVIGGIRKKNRQVIGYGALAMFVLMLYPLTSTASSDAQDILPMWIYLGGVVAMLCKSGEEAIVETEAQNT